MGALALMFPNEVVMDLLGHLHMLKRVKDGITELVCHPGFLGPDIKKRFVWHINCEDELSALTSARVKNLCGELGLKLVSYKGLVDEYGKTSV